jgi:hypothetical protein
MGALKEQIERNKIRRMEQQNTKKHSQDVYQTFKYYTTNACVVFVKGSMFQF